MAMGRLGRVAVFAGTLLLVGTCLASAVGIDDLHQILAVGTQYVMNGDLDEGVELLRHAVAIEPNNVQANVYLGTGLLLRDERKRPPGMHRSNPDLLAAVTVLQHALTLMPVKDSIEVRKYLALGLEHLNLPHVAVPLLREALELHPTDDGLHYTLGRHLDALGELDAAVASYMRAHALKPSPACHGRVSALKKYTADDAHLADMKQMLASGQWEGRERVYLLFALAKAHDDIREYSAAFAFLVDGNARMTAIVREKLGGAVDPITHAKDRLRTMQGYFVKGFGNPMPCVKPDPIFILGLPRSGSTLVEKILAAHSEVTAGGEDTAFAPMNGAMLQELAAADNELDRAAVFRKFGEAYIEEMREALNCTGRHFTDKMLDNFWSIGWMRLMVPGAKIVHCIRDPLDTCLSAFKQPLEGMMGLWTGDLVLCAEYYKAYHAMMAYWKEVLPPDTILDMHYEALVADQEHESRRLLDFVGLEWEDAVLAFHSSAKQSNVYTASVGQVRKPIYSSAVNRWKRYEKHLGPLIQALGPLATGYNTAAAADTDAAPGGGGSDGEL